MTKTEAREIIHDYALDCHYEGYSQVEWEQLAEVEESLPDEIVEALKLSPEAWEHFGYWVWQPIKRWK